MGPTSRDPRIALGTTVTVNGFESTARIEALVVDGPYAGKVRVRFEDECSFHADPCALQFQAQVGSTKRPPSCSEYCLCGLMRPFLGWYFRAVVSIARAT